MKNWIGYAASLLLGALICYLIMTGGCKKEVSKEPVVIKGAEIERLKIVYVDSSKKYLEQKDREIAAKEKQLVKTNAKLLQSQQNEQLLADTLNQLQSPLGDTIRRYVALVQQVKKDANAYIITLHDVIQLKDETIAIKDELIDFQGKLIDTCSTALTKQENYAGDTNKELKKEKQKRRLWQGVSAVLVGVIIYLGIK